MIDAYTFLDQNSNKSLECKLRHSTKRRAYRPLIKGLKPHLFEYVILLHGGLDIVVAGLDISTSAL